MSTADLPKPIYLGLKWNHHQLYTADELRAYGDKRAREAVEAFEVAMKQAWQMIDPLRPPPPGTYWMGEHNGIAAALKTVRENFERALASPSPDMLEKGPQP